MPKTQRIHDYCSVDETTEYLHIEIPQKFSISTLVVSLITIYLVYLKVLDNLLTSWQACFYLMYIFLTIRFFISFYDIIKENNLKETLYEFIGEDDIVIKTENLILLSNLFNLIHYCFCGFCCFFFAEYLDLKNDDYIFYFLNVLIGLLVNQLGFSILSNTKWFDIKTKEKEKRDLENHNHANSHNEANANDSSFVAFCSSLVAPILTYFSNMMVICSANSGVCTQFYLSTLTSLLGAFGITVSNISTYLLPITVIMLIISNISLYIKRKKLSHPPFLLGVFSTFLIIISKLFEENLSILNYLGSILMLIAAIWNMRINKFYGLPSRKK